MINVLILIMSLMSLMTLILALDICLKLRKNKVNTPRKYKKKV